MKLYISTICLVLSVLVVQDCAAQSVENPTPLAPAAEYRVSLIDNADIPMVHVMLNGQGPYKLILDTGTVDTIISPKVVQDLNLDITGQNFAAATVSGTIKLRGVENLNIRLDGAHYHRKLNALVLAKHSPNTAQIDKAFRIADGILGLDFFCNSNLSIDGPKRTLTVRSSSYPVQFRMKKARNCYYLDNGTSFRPTVSANVLGKTVSIFTDTGDVVNKEVVFNSTPTNDVLWRKTTTNYGLVTAERFSGKRLKLTGVKNIKFDNAAAAANLVILLVDPNEDSSPYTFYKNKTANKKLDAVMGWKLLKEGILTIDANDPSQSSFKFPTVFKQEYNWSGFRKVKFTTPSTLLLEEIAFSSPADIAGMHAGDIVTHINGRALSNTDFIWLKNTVFGKNGSTLHVKFKRGQKPMSKTILLYDYLFKQDGSNLPLPAK